MKTLTLREYLRHHKYVGPFKPVPYFSEEGNFVSCYFKDEDCYTETLEGSDNSVEVMRSMRTNEIVGVKIHGIKQLTAKQRD